MSIRLHPKHGLNPTMPICFICGKDTNEIALLGAAYKGKAPMKMCIDKTPCETCQKILANGVMLIEVPNGEEGTENPNRTGYLVGLRLEAAQQIFQDVDFDKHRIFFLEVRTLKSIMGDQYGKEVTP